MLHILAHWVVTGTFSQILFVFMFAERDSYLCLTSTWWILFQRATKQDRLSNFLYIFKRCLSPALHCIGRYLSRGMKANDIRRTFIKFLRIRIRLGSCYEIISFPFFILFFFNWCRSRSKLWHHPHILASCILDIVWHLLHFHQLFSWATSWALSCYNTFDDCEEKGSWHRPNILASTLSLQITFSFSHLINFFLWATSVDL